MHPSIEASTPGEKLVGEGGRTSLLYSCFCFLFCFFQIIKNGLNMKQGDVTFFVPTICASLIHIISMGFFPCV